MKNKHGADGRNHNGKADGKADGNADGKANRMTKVTKLASDKPEARDEGPRLLPLDGVPRYEHYGRAMELGDIALGNKKSQSKKSAASPQVTRHGQPAKSGIKGRPSNA